MKKALLVLVALAIIAITGCLSQENIVVDGAMPICQKVSLTSDFRYKIYTILWSKWGLGEGEILWSKYSYTKNREEVLKIKGQDIKKAEAAREEWCKYLQALTSH